MKISHHLWGGGNSGHPQTCFTLGSSFQTPEGTMFICTNNSMQVYTTSTSTSRTQLGQSGGTGQNSSNQLREACGWLPKIFDPSLNNLKATLPNTNSACEFLTRCECDERNESWNKSFSCTKKAWRSEKRGAGCSWGFLCSSHMQ